MAEPQRKKETRTKRQRGLPVVGWREWLALPDLGIARIKAKIDTGARTSSLHAFDVERVVVDGHERVRFFTKPRQRSSSVRVQSEAELVDVREVRSSNGAVEERLFVRTTARLMDKEWPIELTLTDRDEMGFRMLLGRAALRRRFLVDPGRSFLDRTLVPPRGDADHGERP